jgi:hypothetical protein
MAITRDELKEGVEYKVVVGGGEFSLGEIISLYMDNGTFAPRFVSVSTRTVGYVDLNMIEIHKNEDGTMKNFTKSDLKDWMVVERRNGNKEVVCIARGILLDIVGGHNSIDRINEDLTSRNHEGWDVVAVYSPFDGNHNDLRNFKIGDLIWKREEKSATQLKIEEIEKKQRELADQLRELRESGV